MAHHPSAPSPPLRPARHRRLAALAVLISPLLAACGTGFQAQTNQIYQPGPGISDRNGDVYLINALIVTDGKGNGTLVGALINQAPHADTLTNAGLVCGAKTVDTTIISSTIALPPQRSVQLASTGDVRVSGTLEAGTYCSLTLTFHNAAPVGLGIPIVSGSADFAKVPVGPVPPPSTPSHSNPSS